MTPKADFVLALLIASGCAQAQFQAGVAEPPAFQPAFVGCSMAHCDVRMSDGVRIAPPAGPAVTVIAHDTIPTGSGNPLAPPTSPNQGNGCAANGRIAVCSYSNSFGGNVVAYNAGGTRLWDSGSLFNYTAFASVPMISRSSEVIAADESKVVRFSNTGAVIWNTPTHGGTPISPVVTEAGVVVLATRGGPISAYDGITGQPIGSLYVRQNPGDATFFDTQNTPCVVGNRLYVAMELPADPNYTARLVAVDVDAADPLEPLKVAWQVTYGGPSRASPTCSGGSIFFDGGRLNPGDPEAPQMFRVKDNGTDGSLAWARPAVGPVPASFALDPRGGFWAEFFGSASLQRRSQRTGALMETINIATLVGDPIPNVPMSVLTIAGNSTAPAMIVGTLGSIGASAYVIAIDLNTKTLLWKLNLSPSLGSDNAPVQFPIVLTPTGRPVLVFSGRTSGAYFVTTP